MVARIIGKVFGIFGAVMFLIALVFMVTTLLFISQASVATGTVLRESFGGRTYRATISFITAAGQDVQFDSSVRTSPPEFQVGQKVRVYYNQDDPGGSARVDSFISLWFLPGLFALLGLVFSAIGTAFYLVYFLNKRKQQWLQRNGQRLTAEVSSVRLNTSVRNRGKSPYVIMAQWHDPTNGMVRTFRSNNLWRDPAPFSPGDKVSVLVDPRNYGRYYVDI